MGTRGLQRQEGAESQGWKNRDNGAARAWPTLWRRQLESADQSPKQGSRLAKGVDVDDVHAACLTVHSSERQRKNDDAHSGRVCTRKTEEQRRRETQRGRERPLRPLLKCPSSLLPMPVLGVTAWAAEPKASSMPLGFRVVCSDDWSCDSGAVCGGKRNPGFRKQPVLELSLGYFRGHGSSSRASLHFTRFPWEGTAVSFVGAAWRAPRVAPASELSVAVGMLSVCTVPHGNCPPHVDTENSKCHLSTEKLLLLLLVRLNLHFSSTGVCGCCAGRRRSRTYGRVVSCVSTTTLSYTMQKVFSRLIDE